MVINTEMQNSVKILHRKVWTHGNSIPFFSDNLGQNYFEQTSILKKSLFSSLPLSNNVENVDNIHAGLARLQHC